MQMQKQQKKNKIKLYHDYNTTGSAVYTTPSPPTYKKKCIKLLTNLL